MIRFVLSVVAAVVLVAGCQQSEIDQKCLGVAGPTERADIRAQAEINKANGMTEEESFQFFVAGCRGTFNEVACQLCSGAINEDVYSE